MSDELKRWIRENTQRGRGDASFAQQLLDLIEQIEREFDGSERERLVALARDTYDRHLQLRGFTARARENLAALRSDQQRLLELLDLLATRPAGERLH